MKILKAETTWNDLQSFTRRSAEHPIVVDYAKRRLNEIQKYIMLDAEKNKCLDAGAGDGFFSLQLNEKYDLTIVDSSKLMLDKNPVKDNKLLMDCSSLNFGDNSFNIVFEANVLHHARDCDQILGELVRVSSDYIVILEPNRNHPLTIILGLLKKDERKSLLFSKRYVQMKMEKLNVVHVSSFSFGVIPANKAPIWFWKLMRSWDRSIPFFGLENILIYKKVQS